MIQISPTHWYVHRTCVIGQLNECIINIVVQHLLQVDLALDEILRLQEEGPSDDDVSTILEIEQRAHENGLQVCTISLL